MTEGKIIEALIDQRDAKGLRQLLRLMPGLASRSQVVYAAIDTGMISMVKPCLEGWQQQLDRCSPLEHALHQRCTFAFFRWLYLRLRKKQTHCDEKFLQVACQLSRFDVVSFLLPKLPRFRKPWEELYAVLTPQERQMLLALALKGDVHYVIQMLQDKGVILSWEMAVLFPMSHKAWRDQLFAFPCTLRPFDVFLECPVCFTPSEEVLSCVMLPCTHRFCSHCVPFFSSCPLCRAKLPDETSDSQHILLDSPFDAFWIKDLPPRSKGDVVIEALTSLFGGIGLKNALPSFWKVRGYDFLEEAAPRILETALTSLSSVPTGRLESVFRARWDVRKEVFYKEVVPRVNLVSLEVWRLCHGFDTDCIADIRTMTN